MTRPTRLSIWLAARRWRVARAPGPASSNLANGVMSNIATRSRVTACSAAIVGDHSRASQPQRDAPFTSRRSSSPALASYHCGRSQPAASKKAAPSSSCRGWKGVSRRLPRVLHLLARVDDVVHLAVLLGGASANVAAADGVRLESTDVALAQIQGRLTADDPLGDGPAGASGVGDPYRLRRPETLDTGRFPEHRKPVSGVNENKPLNLRVRPTPRRPGRRSRAAAIDASK